jgi:hypothetical protein
MLNRAFNADDKTLITFYLYFTAKFAIYGFALLLISVFIDTYFLIKNLFNYIEDIFQVKFEDEFQSVKK